MNRIMIPQIRYPLEFPDPKSSAGDAPIAYGGDLSPSRLMLAYRMGIFPWFNENDPILWWSPDPRMVLFLDEFIVRKSLAKRIRNGGFEIKMNSAFNEVMEKCGSVKREDQQGSWITSTMLEAYSVLHDMGHAHSIETYFNGELVGGLYGVAIGSIFYGESMFSLHNDASKVALAHLVEHLKIHGFELIDCQMNTPHLTTLGAREIGRSEFIDIISDGVIKNVIFT